MSKKNKRKGDFPRFYARMIPFAGTLTISDKERDLAGLGSNEVRNAVRVFVAGMPSPVIVREIERLGKYFIRVTTIGGDRLLILASAITAVDIGVPA